MGRNGQIILQHGASESLKDIKGRVNWEQNTDKSVQCELLTSIHVRKLFVKNVKSDYYLQLKSESWVLLIGTDWKS